MPSYPLSTNVQPGTTPHDALHNGERDNINDLNTRLTAAEGRVSAIDRKNGLANQAALDAFVQGSAWMTDGVSTTPLASRGGLVVASTDVNGFVVQTYTPRGADGTDTPVYTRVKAEGGTWNSWRLIAGDTGPRNLGSTLINGWIVAGFSNGNRAILTRSGSRVTLNALLDQSAATTGNGGNFYTVPDGYKPPVQVQQLALGQGNGSRSYVDTGGACFIPFYASVSNPLAIAWSWDTMQP